MNPPRNGEGDRSAKPSGGGARTVITGPTETLERARKLRKQMTLPEVLLWRQMRKRPGGLKFRRQHAAGDYVLDFYCAAATLAIEVDGWAHDNARAVTADAVRSHFLRSQGVATLRVPAKVVLDDLEAALARIVEVCGERIEAKKQLPRVPLHQPAAGPPPRAGEDL